MQYVTTADVHGICPTGWHIPTDGEWTTLTTFLGTNSPGGKIKETGILHWSSPNAGATNSSGYTAIPGGWRDIGGDFGYLTKYANIWSSTQENTSNSWYRSLSNSGAAVGRSNDYKTNGFSVRCVKD
jgi:uncharacterized protein (TIGR02145 family)